MADERLPPHDLRAERCYLGSLLLDEAKALSETPWITEASFVRDSHKALFHALCQCRRETAGNIDLVLIRDYLDRKKLFDAIGGEAALVDIVNAVPDPGHAINYAHILRSKEAMRGLIAASTTLLRAAYDCDDEGVHTAIASTRQAVAAHESDPRDARLVQTFDESATRAFEHIEAVSQGRVSPGLMTGFRDIDTTCGGFQPGELVILAADTSKGKSTLAGNIATNVVRNGKSCLIVSREMLPADIGKRFIQADSQISGKTLRWPRIKELTQTDYANLAKSATGWAEAKGVIDAKSKTVEHIADHARKLAERWGRIDLIVVDYIGLLAGDGRTRAEQVSRIAWELKTLATDLDTVVLALSQFNRVGVKSENPPTIHDLKESGDLENTASSAILLHLPAVPAREGNALVMQVCIAKSRNGEVCPWPSSDNPGLTLLWKPWEMRFFDREVSNDGF